MSYLTFKKVRTADEADDEAINITLFRAGADRVCGWFLGPTTLASQGVRIPYLPRSEQAIASIAIVRAVEAARVAKSPICIIDPEDLWDPAWQVKPAQVCPARNL